MDTNSLPSSRAEAKAIGSDYYFTGKPCKHGHIAPRKTKGACVECLKIEWEANRTKRTEYFKQYNRSEAGQKSKRKYYEKNKEIVMLKASMRSPEEKRFHRKKHKERNPEQYRILLNSRRRRHKNATPKWLTKEEKRQIRQIYQDAATTTRITGIKYVVDHICPLKGETVCGLHIPSNLRIITQEENLAKSNKLIDS